MSARDDHDTDPGNARRDASARRRVVSATVNAAISRGFVIGCEVLLGSIPGIVVGYNMANFGRLAGNSHPLVVRTAMGVTQCGMEQVRLV